MDIPFRCRLKGCPTGRVRLKDWLFSTAPGVKQRIDHDDFDCECYANVGIINGDGQTCVPEAAVLGGKLETGLAVAARPEGKTVRHPGRESGSITGFVLENIA